MLFGVMGRRLIAVLLVLGRVPRSGSSVVCRLLMVACLMVLCGVVVMLASLFVVLGSFLVRFCSFFRH